MKYIFDFDGTLVDSMPTWSGALINALKKAGIPVPDGFVNTLTPLGNYKASEYTISLGLDITLKKYLDDLSKYLYREYTTNVRLKDNVKETLEELIRRGHSLSVLTASPHLYVDECLQNNGVFVLFEKVWTIDDFGHTKSEVIIYEEAAERLGTAVSDCVFVDDNLTALTTAKKSGMYTAAIYDDTSAQYMDEIKKVSDVYAVDFADILKFYS